MKGILCRMVIVGAVLSLAGRAQSAQLFGVDVTYSGGTISQSASSLPDLVDALVNNQDAFTPLVGNDYSASLT